ncbi:WD repeat-containing protein [Reticulomyxa filosa]|uniref:WD repeat-containing protein n=1 Tax=Reticulomyxa filosa TaxID=46433 RepID=X6P2J7_RETFI|nr:WD repeat-containing protein [Reticulomyxa filosa]|eukprot:ETO32426.1 WD repeat-containing protein [Reticulomyxa filosa]
MFDEFCSSSKLLKTLIGHISYVNSIDYSTFDGDQFICSGSSDSTVRVWDVDTRKQIRLFEEHTSLVYCVKFSRYHYHNYHQSVICSSSHDNTIRFWDFKDNQQLRILSGHTRGVYVVECSPFNSGRYLCSGSRDATIRLWDIKTYKSLHTFNGHTSFVRCVNISPMQSNSNKNGDQSNNIGVIGGNGYTICSGSNDTTIRTWDIETTKQLNVFEGHGSSVNSVKYGSNDSGIISGANTILSGSNDASVRLWDIRSGQQIQMFDGHTDYVFAAEYSPFVTDNIEIGGSSNVICSGSKDNTIRFWDIRSDNKELFVIEGDEYSGIYCLKLFSLKKKVNNNKQRSNDCFNLCYGLGKGPICIWG